MCPVLFDFWFAVLIRRIGEVVSNWAHGFKLVILWFQIGHQIALKSCKNFVSSLTLHGIYGIIYCRNDVLCGDGIYDCVMADIVCIMRMSDISDAKFAWCSSWHIDAASVETDMDIAMVLARTPKTRLPTVLQFLQSFGVLYDLYKTWFDRNQIADKPLGKNTFIRVIAELADAGKISGWRCPGKKSPVRPKHLMDAPKPVIAYAVSPELLKRRQTYTGLLRV